MIMAPEVAEYITGSLASVRSVPVKNSFIAVVELGVRPPVKKEVRWMTCWLLCGVLPTRHVHTCERRIDRAPASIHSCPDRRCNRWRPRCGWTRWPRLAWA